MSNMSESEKFRSKYVVAESGCWEWQPPLTDGYGRFYIGNSYIKAHRYSYENSVGEIPRGFYVLHQCDNRKCVNPDHLSIGTHEDNMRDMVERGRGRTNPKNGENNPSAKLTEEKVEEIRSLILCGGKSQRQIAREYSVSPSVITEIKYGRAWGGANIAEAPGR